MLYRRNSSPRGVSQLSDAANNATLSNNDAIMTNKEQLSSAVTGITTTTKERTLLSILKRPHDIRCESEQCFFSAPPYSQSGIAITSPTNSLKSSNFWCLWIVEHCDTNTAMCIAAFYTDANVVSAYTGDDDDTDTERFDLKKNGCFPRAPIRLGSNREDDERTKWNMRRMTINSNLHDNKVNKDYNTPLYGLMPALTCVVTTSRSMPTSTPRLRTESRVSSASSLEDPCDKHRVAFTIPNSLPPVIDNDASLGGWGTYSSVRTAGKIVNCKKSKGVKGEGWSSSNNGCWNDGEKMCILTT